MMRTNFAQTLGLTVLFAQVQAQMMEEGNEYEGTDPTNYENDGYDAEEYSEYEETEGEANEVEEIAVAPRTRNPGSYKPRNIDEDGFKESTTLDQDSAEIDEEEEQGLYEEELEEEGEAEFEADAEEAELEAEADIDESEHFTETVGGNVDYDGYEYDGSVPETKYDMFEDTIVGADGNEGASWSTDLEKEDNEYEALAESDTHTEYVQEHLEGDVQEDPFTEAALAGHVHDAEHCEECQEAAQEESDMTLMMGGLAFFTAVLFAMWFMLRSCKQKSSNGQLDSSNPNSRGRYRPASLSPYNDDDNENCPQVELGDIHNNY